jgi:1-aminocyclopropane-1-carboxylate deaminase/D-cysteine desulfhydrase-like pyridoxal-dependent ACC family enzyme
MRAKAGAAESRGSSGGSGQQSSRYSRITVEDARRTIDQHGHFGGIPRGLVEANCGYVGAGYGIPTDGMAEAVKLVARTEGIFLDPV